jgi:hypothetical protein
MGYYIGEGKKSPKYYSNLKEKKRRKPQRHKEHKDR